MSNYKFLITNYEWIIRTAKSLIRNSVIRNSIIRNSVIRNSVIRNS